MNATPSGLQNDNRFDHSRGGAPQPNLVVLALALVLLAGGGALIAQAHGWRQGALYALGAALGLVLYHAAFGFAASWRRFLSRAAARACAPRC